MQLPKVNLQRILELYPPVTKEQKEEMILQHARLALKLARQYGRRDLEEFQGEALAALTQIVHDMPHRTEGSINPTMFIHISLTRHLARFRLANQLIRVKQKKQTIRVGHLEERYQSPTIRPVAELKLVVAECLDRAKLSERELEVLELVRSQATNHEIGNVLGVTRERGRQLREAVLAKLWKAYHDESD